MPDSAHTRGIVHPRTAVLTRGFDPSLSFGSARPAVFRSSTYVFASPEASERAFQITHGKIKLAEGDRADLIYSRISHPNAEILEDQIVPLEPGGREAAVFNSGMAAAYPGGIFSMEFKSGKHAAFEFLRRVEIARNAVSLGGVETLTCHPKSTTHSGMSPEELAASGVTDGLVRVSVGIEDRRDLLADFEQALAATG